MARECKLSYRINGIALTDIATHGFHLVKSDERISLCTNWIKLSMSLSCIVNGGNTISVSIQKDAGIELNLEQNQCWFAVHEIK